MSLTVKREALVQVIYIGRDGLVFSLFARVDPTDQRARIQSFE